jgi:hypothetical protein
MGSGTSEKLDIHAIMLTFSASQLSTVFEFLYSITSFLRMRTLVTGSSGFMGSKIFEDLASLEEIDHLAGWDINGKSVTRLVDVTDPEAVRDGLAADRPNTVLHFVNHVDPRDVERERKVIVSGTKNLLQACHSSGGQVKKVVIPSSRAVYRHHNGVQKLARLCEYNAEILKLISYFRSLGLSIVVLCFPQICGKGEKPVGEPRRYRQLLEAKILGRTLTIPLSDAGVPYLHLDDVVQLVRRLTLSKIDHEDLEPSAHLVTPDLLARFLRQSGELGKSLFLRRARLQYVFETSGYQGDFTSAFSNPEKLLEQYLKDVKADLEMAMRDVA